MTCSYFNENTGEEETYVVRTQNMHSCLRMTGQIAQFFDNNGSIALHPTFSWEKFWNAFGNDYERRYNPSLWGVVYYQGKPVFTSGDHHIFFDLIEKFDFESGQDYEAAPVLAQNALNQKDKTVRIDYKGSVACVVKWEDGEAHVSIILRDAQRETTFSFKVSENNEDKPIQIGQCFSVAAAFLEAIQLCFFIGSAHAKMQRGFIQRKSEEHKQLNAAMPRLARLGNEIIRLESNSKIRYRPEKPDFDHIVFNAQQTHGAFLDKKIASGELKVPKKNKTKEPVEDDVDVEDNSSE
jgi:hypothetical protein